KLRPDFKFSHPGVRKIGILMLPAVFGSAVYQLNIFVGTLLASFLPTGSVSYLYYADRVVQLPLGVFAIAVGTAALPTLSQYAALKDYEELKRTLSFSLRIILFVTIPCMIALFVLRVPIISVLFQHGKFDTFSTARTADALFFYAVGLWAFSGVKVIVSAFYALKDTATPVKIAFCAFIVNVIASLLLMGPLAHGGLALAISIASSVNVVVLCLVLRRKIGSFLDREFTVSIIRCLLASIVMGGLMAGLLFLMGWDVNNPLSARLAMLVATILTGMAAFIFSSLVLGSVEMKVLSDRILKILPKRTR
ncbi:MAG: murein biosynthesis integral membrane protein MurJ, partial [Syntrophales bacterium]|nr:murein biosynthesis integral membrane protein MurJ [Syntrophales bacterium]